MPKKPKQIKVRVLFKDIPRNLRDHFKAWCALRGVTMRDMFLSFLKETIEKRMKQ